MALVLQGSLHNHTNWSDGANSLLEMAQAAQALGMNYLAITDHATTIPMVPGVNAASLIKQGQEIDQLNKKLAPFVLLKGVEVDILPNGQLFLPKEVLNTLDIVVASVHTHMELPKLQQTERLLSAISCPWVSILGHPTGRFSDSTTGYPVDLYQVMDQMAQTGGAIELNSNPRRLDIDEQHCRYAKLKKIPVAINADAHRVTDLKHLEKGLEVAEKAGLSEKNILNTRPLMSLREWLLARKQK